MTQGSFNWHFPATSSVVRSGHLVAPFLAVTGCVVCLGGQSVVGLGLVSIGLGIFGLWIDRSLIGNWLITPTMWFSSICILSGGIGPILLVLADTEDLVGVIPMQVGICVGHIVFFCVYALARPRGNIPAVREELLRNADLRHAIVGAGILCLAWSVSDTVVGAVTGAADRGEAGEAAAYQFFGIWSYFGAFSRLNAVGFILVPVVWAFGGWLSRVYSLASAIIVIGVGLLTGSRYSAFMPFVAMSIGYFGLVTKPRIRLEWLAIAALPVAAFLFIFLDHFRNTEAFRKEALADPVARLRAVGEARERGKDMEGIGWDLLGGRLIGTIDPQIFESTPSVIPNAGFEGIDALLWIYVPYFFYPYRPTLQDGKWIAEEYLGRVLIRTSIGPSLIGDWYRRFGWVGIGVGMGLVALFVSLCMRVLVMELVSMNSFAIATWLVCTVFVLKDANMTLLTGLWWMLYDIPKQAFLLWVFMRIGRWVGTAMTSPESRFRQLAVSSRS